jgi:ribosome-associated protein
VSVIRVTREIAIDEGELEERFFHASGPGGQHVNKAATAVQLRFDATHSPALPDDVRERLIDLAGNQVTDDGVLVINAQRFRSQRRNRRDARQRLVALIRQAAKTPRQRRKTGPSRASKERRLEEKRRSSEKKRLRRPPKEW